MKYCRWAPTDVSIRDAVLMHRKLWYCDVDVVAELTILASHSSVWVLRRHVVGCWCYWRYLQTGGAGHWYWGILWCEGWLKFVHVLMLRVSLGFGSWPRHCPVSGRWVSLLVCMFMQADSESDNDFKQVQRRSTGRGAICTIPLVHGACLKCSSYTFRSLRRVIQAHWASRKSPAGEGSIFHGSIPWVVSGCSGVQTCLQL